MDKPSPTSSRHIAIDLARVIAIVFMVQGHTLDVLLSPDLRQGFLFDKWLFLRGLTAPTFFMLSGVSFFMASRKQWDSYLEPSTALWRRLSRFGMFVVLGYVMHLPVRTVHDFQWLDAAGWQSWFQVDVLQCIGFTLAFLQLLVYLAKTPERFAKLALGSAVFVVLLSPILWRAGATSFLAPPIAAYFNGSVGSFFPLFPWAAYVLFGSAVGFFCAEYQSASGALPVRQLAVGGLSLFTVGEGLQLIPWNIYGSIDFWHTSPSLFLVRVGCVCLLLSALALLVQRITLPQQAIRSLAKESLLIYFVHISILYGSLWNTGLRQSIGPTLAFLPTLGWIALMVLTMLLLAWTWSWFKKAAPRRSFALQAAIVLIGAYSLS